ncbi:hypothetical protein TM01_09120 [Campylobacter jejuni subsp. jejuni]|nr:hypothetical protein TM01_09120 [Campylobacter jejuni subsp. jejuni]
MFHVWLPCGSGVVQALKMGASLVVPMWFKCDTCGSVMVQVWLPNGSGVTQVWLTHGSCACHIWLRSVSPVIQAWLTRGAGMAQPWLTWSSGEPQSRARCG